MSQAGGASGMGGGNGNVTGPGSSIDGDIAVFDGVTGKIIKDTGISSTNPTFVGTVTGANLVSLGNITMGDTNALGTSGVFKLASGQTIAIAPIPGGANFFFGNSGNTTLSGIANTMTGQASGNGLSSGIQNCGYGNGSLLALNIGSGNSAYGYFSSSGLTNGVNNVSIGYAAHSQGDGYDECIAIGTQALDGTIGDNNIGIGSTAGNAALTSENSVFIGNGAGALTGGSNPIGSNSIGIGQGALQAGGGDNNIGIGTFIGTPFGGTEANNILINHVGFAGDNNTLRIGTQGSGSNQVDTTFIAGIFGVTVAASSPVVIDASGQMGTIVSSAKFKEDVQDLDSSKILDLRPVSFKYIGDETKEFHAGLIAEEVNEVIPDLVVCDAEGAPFTVKYQEICMYLLQEVKKLSLKVKELEQRFNV